MVGIKIVDYILGGIMSELLKVNNLSVAIDDTEILKNIDFTIVAGETHVPLASPLWGTLHTR